MAIVEAFACGVPAIVPGLGACAEIVADGGTGLRFNAGDAADLAAKIEWAWTHPLQMREMGLAARAEFEAKYTAPRNLRMLLELYERAISRDLPGLPAANVSAPNLSLMTRPCVTPHV
jgi:glycosyltransferase involved in cell wall biosynthesis